MATIQTVLEQAVEYHQAGDLAQAEQLYKEVLHADPHHAVALQLLGAVVRQSGNNELAIDYFRQALHLKPDYIEAHHNLGNALAQLGRLAEAGECYLQALRLKPDYALSHNSLGNILVDLGRLDEAVASYQQAVRLDPDFGNAQYNLGLALKMQGKNNEALACFRQAIRTYPPAKKVHDDLRNTLAAQGLLDEAVAGSDQALRVVPDHLAGHLAVGDFHLRQGRLYEASISYRQALSLQPEIARAVNNLGVALYRQGKLETAVACYRTALQLQPDFAEALDNLGNGLTSQGRLEEAVACYRQAVQVRPDYAGALNDLGVALHQQAKFDEALACYDEALRLDPDSVLPHLNRAIAWLLLGNFEQGWSEYEWRLKAPGGPMRPSHPPRWDGSPLAGRTVMLYWEQGLGDTVHFIRYAPLLKEQGARVIVECQKPLTRLLAGCPGIDQLVAQGSTWPECDFQASLPGLPGILGTSLTTIPANVPYLFADSELLEHWRQELRGSAGLKIGVAWQGNPGHPLDRVRSFRLEQLAPVAKLPGIRLFSLQKGPGIEQLVAVADSFSVTDLGTRLDEASGAFMDTAAVMKNLDLVITSDTVIAHLAGALGVPVWVALAKVPDWRWLLERQDSPWYPTMRLFRQKESGDWAWVFQQMQQALREPLFVRGGASQPDASSGPLTIEVAPGELIDKISILEIKSERITDPGKLLHVREELAALAAARDKVMTPSTALTKMAGELKEVNESLWQVEDKIRDCERRQDFGAGFTELARLVYRHNDRRAALKRRINELLGSRIVEEKSYPGYERSDR
jgi:tetratricopeptide (TPR) repeat protein